MVFNHVMRRPCRCTKQKQIIAQVLHKNGVKSPKYFFSIVLRTNMAAVPSDESHSRRRAGRRIPAQILKMFSLSLESAL